MELSERLTGVLQAHQNELQAQQAEPLAEANRLYKDLVSLGVAQEPTYRLASATSLLTPTLALRR